MRKTNNQLAHYRGVARTQQPRVPANMRNRQKTKDRYNLELECEDMTYEELLALELKKKLKSNEKKIKIMKACISFIIMVTFFTFGFKPLSKSYRTVMNPPQFKDTTVVAQRDYSTIKSTDDKKEQLKKDIDTVATAMVSNNEVKSKEEALLKMAKRIEGDNLKAQMTQQESDELLKELGLPIPPR